MMNCREYVYLLTSEQLPQSDTLTRMQSVGHRYLCRNCRAFTLQHQALDQALQVSRQGLIESLHPQRGLVVAPEGTPAPTAGSAPSDAPPSGP